MSDAVKVLMDDHSKVERLFKQAGEAAKYEYMRQICQELSVHAALEEEFIYPLLEEIDPDTASESLEEHEQMKGLIEEIENMDPNDPQIRQAARMLKNALAHHVEEEENNAFPRLSSSIDRDRMREIGREMFARRQDLLAQLT